MPAHIVRADYDQLNHMAAAFAQQSELTRKALQQIRGCQDTLAGGDWLGQGANGFYAEMNGQVLPTLNRLARALDAASSTTRQIRAIMKAAEDEAARYLNQQGGRAAPAGAAAPGAGAGSPAGRSSPGLAAIAGGQIKGSVVKENVFIRALKPMNPMDMLGMLDKARKKLDLPDNVLDVLDTVNEYQKKVKRTGGLSKFMKNPVIDKFSKGIAFYDIGRNSLKLLTDATDGNGLELQSLQIGADLFSDVMGLVPNPLTKAFNAGYSVGKFLNETFGLSTKIANFFRDDSQYWSTRHWMDNYVTKYGTASEQANFKQWSADRVAAARAAQQTGRPEPPYRLPDLPVFKKVDPQLVKLAEKNVNMPDWMFNRALQDGWSSVPYMMKMALMSQAN